MTQAQAHARTQAQALACEQAPGEDGKDFRRAQNRRIRREKKSAPGENGKKKKFGERDTQKF